MESMQIDQQEGLPKFKVFWFNSKGQPRIFIGPHYPLFALPLLIASGLTFCLEQIILQLNMVWYKSIPMHGLLCLTLFWFFQCFLANPGIPQEVLDRIYGNSQESNIASTTNSFESVDLEETTQRSSQYCGKCQYVKKIRDFHCSMCGVCIENMDHHCKGNIFYFNGSIAMTVVSAATVLCIALYGAVL